MEAFTVDNLKKIFKKQSLKDFSDDEIFLILSKNEVSDYPVLACICSEVLRRQMEKERQPNSVGEDG